MWRALRRSAGLDPALASLTGELLRSTHRTLVYAVAGAYLLSIVASAGWPDAIGTPVWLLAPIIALACVGTLRLLERNPALAQTLWQVGLATAVTLTIHLFQVREFAFLYALLPFMAMIGDSRRLSFLGHDRCSGLVVVFNKLPDSTFELRRCCHSGWRLFGSRGLDIHTCPAHDDRVVLVQL